MAAPKILVVEDEGIVGMELVDALGIMGYEVPPVVPSGDEALAAVAATRPDLILMDIRLSGALDGIETARRIRERFHIPVIYLTAHSDEATIQRAKLSESFGYLLKPFEARALRASIETALYKAEREREREVEPGWNEAVGEYLPDGLVITDAKGLVKYCNHAAAVLAGVEPAACRDKPFAEVFPATDPVTREPAALPLSAAMAEDRTITADQLFCFGPGRVLADWVLKPVKDRFHAAAGAVCLLKPVKAEDKTERELRFELERVGRYQSGLLPEQGRSIHGVRSGWLFHPSLFGSGDVFNVFPLGDRRVGFYLLDVMGHGFQAAVLAVTVYSFLSNDVTRLGILTRPAEAGEPAGRVLGPAEVIAELNRRFYYDSGDNPFFTIVYGVIDAGLGKGNLARAGHVPPLYATVPGAVERLMSRGQAVGAMPEIAVEEKEFAFPKGARLFVFSDGLVDVLHRKGEEISDERLIRFLAERSSLDLEQLCTGLDALVAETHPDPVFEDDIAFLALERE
jgi:serine phosphatase RsbU (regulator of sigma subunit)/CheY-like chemotaxis protein